MTTRKILVTGHAIGGEPDNPCVVCNYDFSWIINNPSSLIWTDKIILTPYIHSTIESGNYPDKGGKIARSLKTIFNVANDYNLIEISDPKPIITDELSEALEEEINIDRQSLCKLFPETIREGDTDKVPGELYIENQAYCTPVIWSIYSSLILAREWDAQILFSNRVLNYCKYKFGSSLIDDASYGTLPKSFNEVFRVLLPEENLYPYYCFWGDEQCDRCKRKTECENTFEYKLEENLRNYLELRNRDEIHQIKTVINDIVSRLEKEGKEIIFNSIIKDYKEEERELSKMVYGTFPKVTRVANLSLFASIPITYVGYQSGLPIVSEAGIALAGISTAIKEIIKYKENKSNWIGFINKNLRYVPPLTHSDSNKMNVEIFD